MILNSLFRTSQLTSQARVGQCDDIYTMRQYKYVKLLWTVAWSFITHWFMLVNLASQLFAAIIWQLQCVLPDFQNIVKFKWRPSLPSNLFTPLILSAPSSFLFRFLSCLSLPFPVPVSLSVWLTRCFSSLSLKPVRSSCCGRGRGGSGVKLFPPRARRHACSLDEQAAAWSQSSQVSALRGEQLYGAHGAAKWFGGNSGPWGA